jgi:hypothetical protein
MFCLFTDPIINNRICKIMCPVVGILNRFALLSDPFTVYLYTVSLFSLYHNRFVLRLPLLRYMIIQYLIRTLRLSVSVRLYVLRALTPANFSISSFGNRFRNASLFCPFLLGLQRYEPFLNLQTLFFLFF